MAGQTPLGQRHTERMRKDGDGIAVPSPRCKNSTYAREYGSSMIARFSGYTLNNLSVFNCAGRRVIKRKTMLGSDDHPTAAIIILEYPEQKPLRRLNLAVIT